MNIAKSRIWKSFLKTLATTFNKLIEKNYKEHELTDIAN